MNLRLDVTMLNRNIPPAFSSKKRMSNTLLHRDSNMNFETPVCCIRYLLATTVEKLKGKAKRKDLNVNRPGT